MEGSQLALNWLHDFTFITCKKGHWLPCGVSRDSGESAHPQGLIFPFGSAADMAGQSSCNSAIPNPDASMHVRNTPPPRFCSCLTSQN